MHLKGFSIKVIYCNTYICTWYLEYEVLHLVETIIQICGLNYVYQNSNLPNLLYSNLSIFIKLKYTGGQLNYIRQCLFTKGWHLNTYIE